MKLLLRMSAFLALVLVLGGATLSLAQEAAAPTPAQPAAPEAKPDPEIEKFDRAVRDLERVEGAFTLLRRRRDVLLELPESKLGQLFFVQPTLHTGFASMGGQAGDPLGFGGVAIFRFEHRDDSVWLVRPNTRFRWADGDPLALASERAFPEAILEGFRVEARHPERKVLLVNITSLFHGGLFRLQDTVNLTVGGSYTLDRDKSGVESIRGFPDKTVVRKRLHFQSRGGTEDGLGGLLALLGLGGETHLEDSRSIPLQVTYSMWYRQPSDYMPRLADPRVGFFTEDYFDLARFEEPDRTSRYIVRFHLQKKNPRAELSEPVRPIVWVIDPSVPEEFRPAVRRGVLSWNAAFERIGFKNALQVVDAPKDDPTYDHADGRQNVIRWAMSPSAAYAVALFRNDPITGQVLNASITVDANMPTAFLQEYRILITGNSHNIDEQAKRVLLRSESPLSSMRQLWNTKADQLEEVKHRAEEYGWHFGCNDFALRSAAYRMEAWMALRAVGADISEKEYVEGAIQDIVAHEIGHTLGLRHNFAGSTHLTTQQLLDDDIVRRLGVSASVMEYTPINYMAVLRGSGVFFNTGPGPYDKWAIRYGYQPIVARNPEDELPTLRAIARQSGRPGLAYLTDEDADGINPLASTFDGASDSLNFLRARAQTAVRMRDYAIHNLTQPGESYHMRNMVVINSYLRNVLMMREAARFLGGVEFRRHFKGDIGERPTLSPVDPRTQREAIRLIADSVFGLKSLDIPDRVLLSLNQDPSGEAHSTWNAPVRSILARAQMMMLATVLSASTIDAIAENEFKLANRRDRYTIAEHYGVVMGAIMDEVGRVNKVTPLRRDLQANLVEALATQAGSAGNALNGEARQIANHGLRRLRTRFYTGLQNPNLDSATKLHFEAQVERIDRFLAREVMGNR